MADWNIPQEYLDQTAEIKRLQAENERLRGAISRASDELCSDYPRRAKDILDQAFQTKGRAADDYDPRKDQDLPAVLRDPQETLRRGRDPENPFNKYTTEYNRASDARGPTQTTEKAESSRHQGSGDACADLDHRASDSGRLQSEQDSES